MSASTTSASVPWYKEPTKDQWYAYSAAWLGWTLDAFDFTVFLFIIGPISDEFKVPVTEVTSVFTSAPASPDTVRRAATGFRWYIPR